MIYLWIRATVDWADEAAFMAQCDPAFRPKVELWNATFSMPFHRFRARVGAIAASNLGRVDGATACAAWEAIPDGAVVLPVDDDDWFAPDAADELCTHWSGEGGGCSWTSTFVEVALHRRHALGTAVRGAVPLLGPKWVCTTNNYALVKGPGTQELAASHVRASAWFDAHRPPRLDLRISAMNRTLASRTSLGHRRPAISRAELLDRYARYRRLYRSPRLRAPGWCAPYVTEMAELMDELELR